MRDKKLPLIFSLQIYILIYIYIYIYAGLNIKNIDLSTYFNNKGFMSFFRVPPIYKSSEVLSRSF